MLLWWLMLLLYLWLSDVYVSVWESACKHFSETTQLSIDFWKNTQKHNLSANPQTPKASKLYTTALYLSKHKHTNWRTEGGQQRKKMSCEMLMWAFSSPHSWTTSMYISHRTTEVNWLCCNCRDMKTMKPSVWVSALWFRTCEACLVSSQNTVS